MKSLKPALRHFETRSPLLSEKLTAVFMFSLLLTSLAFGEGTRTWEQSKFDDLSKGTAKGVAIRSNGGLELAPSFKPVYTTPATYVWSIAADDNGTVYVATGSPARVYRVTPDGKAVVIFEAKELQVQAVAVDKSGAVYAATTPDGKVYKIEHKAASSPAADKSAEKSEVDPGWSSSVFVDPGTKYIWALQFDAAGNLFVATGDKGEILKVIPKGERSAFFKSSDAHVRTLALDGKGNLIAGSDGSGLIYRISPTGEGFVLYSAAKKEITALTTDDAGNIYAAGVGDKRAGGIPGMQMTPTVTPQMGTGGGPTGMSPHGGGTGMTAAGPGMGSPIGAVPFPGIGATGGSEVYRIAPDGAPQRIWSSRDDIVYDLAFDGNHRLMAGTGNRGHVYEIYGDGDFSDLLKAGASQVTAMAKAPKGALYAATSNLGKVFLLAGSQAEDGTYESDVFDSHIFSRWGHLEQRSTGAVELYARSGNVEDPENSWSAWKRIDASGAIDAPAARFLQWKAVLKPGSTAPRLDSVLVNFLSRNVAPEVGDVNVQVGVRYQVPAKSLAPEITLTSSGPGPAQPRFEPPVPTARDRSSIGVKWSAHDDNDDQLTYTLYYRGDGESRWRKLADDVTDKFYSFDASLLPDGGYVVQVVASDAPSHSPGEALTGEDQSTRFEVDTTPPRIENLSAALDGTQIHITFRAADNESAIKRAEYSVDAGDWQYVEPVGQLSDSKTESYDFRVTVPGEDKSGASAAKSGKKAVADVSTEHLVVVRVFDRYDNLTSAKTVIRGR
jgi:sugar lactone lactonase YvrE